MELVATAVMALLAIGIFFFVRFATASKPILTPYIASHAGWSEIGLSQSQVESLRRSNGKFQGATGNWNGLRAEVFASSSMPRYDKTAVAVIWPSTLCKLEASPCYGSIGLIPGPGAGRDLKFFGAKADIEKCFTPTVQKAILAFPKRIITVSFEGKSVVIWWTGGEKDANVLDAGLELCRTIGQEICNK